MRFGLQKYIIRDISSPESINFYLGCIQCLAYLKAFGAFPVSLWQFLGCCVLLSISGYLSQIYCPGKSLEQSTILLWFPGSNLLAFSVGGTLFTVLAIVVVMLFLQVRFSVTSSNSIYFSLLFQTFILHYIQEMEFLKSYSFEIQGSTDVQTSTF